MKYVALLRGVNVGGKAAINMRELAGVFEAAGMAGVKTYINSGNVVFEASSKDRAKLTRALESAIEKHFGLSVRVLVKSRDEIASIVAALPEEWANDSTSKCDVFFLWPALDKPDVLKALDYDPAIDDVRYTPGAVLRHTPRDKVARSKLTKVVGTPLHQEMTIRNCNTTRKLLTLLDA